MSRCTTAMTLQSRIRDRLLAAGTKNASAVADDILEIVQGVPKESPRIPVSVTHSARWCGGHLLRVIAVHAKEGWGQHQRKPASNIADLIENIYEAGPGDFELVFNGRTYRLI